MSRARQQPGSNDTAAPLELEAALCHTDTVIARLHSLAKRLAAPMRSRPARWCGRTAASGTALRRSEWPEPARPGRCGDIDDHAPIAAHGVGVGVGDGERLEKSIAGDETARATAQPRSPGQTVTNRSKP